MTGAVTIDGVNVCTQSADIAALPAVGDHIVALLGQPLDKAESLYHVGRTSVRGARGASAPAAAHGAGHGPRPSYAR